MNVLITGVAGTGKSTIAHELRRRGFAVYDIDDDTDVAYSRNKQTGTRAVSAADRSADWAQDHNWVWDSRRLQHLLQTQSHGLIIYCGYADNQPAYYHLFDKQFALAVETEKLQERLLHRHGNEYGKIPSERQSVVAYYPEFMNMCAIYGLTPIDANGPLETTVDDLVAQLTKMSNL